MVNVENMKRKMLGRIEGMEDPNIDYELFVKMQKEQRSTNNKQGDGIDEN